MRFSRWVIVVCVVAVVVGASFLALAPEPAEADSLSAKTEKLLRVLKSDAGLSLKLCALEALRNQDETGIEAEIVKLATGSDAKLAMFSATALGKMKTATSKAKLIDLVGSTTVAKNVRIAAMTAVAVHFKTSGDVTTLTAKIGSDKTLKAHLTWLSTNVYGR